MWGAGPGLLLGAVLLDLLDPDPHVAGPAAVLRTENAGFLELVHQTSRATVTDAELPLEQRGGATLVLDAGHCGLLEERVALRGVHALLTAAFAALGIGHFVEDVRLRRLRHAALIAFLPPFVVAPHESLALLGPDVGPLEPHRLALS